MHTAIATWVPDYLLNSVWQLPLVYVAASLAARGLRRMRAEAEHRVWVAALLLSVVLPGCRFSGWPLAWWGTRQGRQTGTYRLPFYPARRLWGAACISPAR